MKLFEPIEIGEMKAKNRIIMAPMGMGLGYRNQKARDFYVERAKGGVGLIIIGGVPVDYIGKDEFIQEIRSWIIDPVHEHGAKIGLQLWYGNEYPFRGGLKSRWVAPSPGIPIGLARHLFTLYKTLPRASEPYCRELTIDDIQDIIFRYTVAAVKSKEAGFDFIEIHACHAHNLPDQFFSPLDNRRTDTYGGDLSGRMQFGVKLTEAIRSTIPDDYPLFWRLSAEQGFPGGYTLEESLQYSVELAKAGVNVIDVSFGQGTFYEPAPVTGYCAGPDEPPGTFLPYAEAFKRRLSIPVIAMGRLGISELAETTLLNGKADMVAIGRQLIADPHWPQKVASGRLEDVIPCLSCNTCLSQIGQPSSKPMRCAVNPSLRSEERFATSRTESAKEVLVVGGGPAGLQAARVLALRGHKVTLCERENRLGGQLVTVVKAPHKQEISRLIDYLITQVQKTETTINLNHEITANFIKELKPDVVILATGALPLYPGIPGINPENVVTAINVLTGRVEVGEKVVILGGELTACDTAEFLAEMGKKVIITRRGQRIGAELWPRERQILLCRLGAKGVTMLPGIRYEEIRKDRLVITDRTGRKVTLEADTIVLAIGSVPNSELAKQLEGKISELHLIGDCAEPRRIIDAIADAEAVGAAI